MTASTVSSKHLLGWTFVLLVAAIWVAASFLAQYQIAQYQMPPLLLSYICTSMFGVYLPLLHAKRHCSSRRRRHAAQEHGAGGSTAWLAIDTGNGAPEDGSTALQQTLLPDQATVPNSEADTAGTCSPQPRSTSLVRAALMVGPLWLLSSLLFNLSLANTSVTSNTILSSSSSLFTYTLSILVLGERPTLQKAASVLLVMGGTALVTLSDSAGAGDDQVQRSLLGDLMAVGSAGCYACYTVIIRRVFREDDADGVAELFGLIGVMSMLGLLPVVIGAQLLGAVDLWSLSAQALGLALLTGLLDYVLSDYLWARAVLLIGPTAATLGLNIQIPLASSVDLLLGHPRWLSSNSTIAMAAGGTLAILMGVAGINLSAPDDVQETAEEAAVDLQLEGPCA